MLSEQVRNELEAVRAIYGVRTALDYDEDAPLDCDSDAATEVLYHLSLFPFHLCRTTSKSDLLFGRPSRASW